MEQNNGTVQNGTLCFLAGLWCWLVGWLFFLINVFFFQSNDNEERLQVVKLLAKMFGAKDSELASQNKPLWQCYLGRYAILVLLPGDRKHSVNCNPIFLNSLLSSPSPCLFYFSSQMVQLTVHPSAVPEIWQIMFRRLFCIYLLHFLFCRVDNYKSSLFSSFFFFFCHRLYCNFQ